MNISGKGKNKKRILFFGTRRQFGYRIDSFEYCRLLQDEFDVVFYSLDFGLPRIEMQGITVVYKKRHSNKALRYLQTLSSLIRYVRKENIDIVFLEYFYLCSIVKILLGKKAVVMDVRTGSVSESLIKNFIYNSAMFLEHHVFKNITVISSGLIDHLHFKKNKCHVLPLGAKEAYLDFPKKDFSALKLLYIGELHPGRGIGKTLTGFLQFKKTLNQEIDITYDIVGEGPVITMQEMREFITANGLQKNIRMHGFIPHEMIGKYLNECNIGINFIPMTSYYDNQPPTKLFEYALAGLALLSTRTSANMENFTDDLGVAINDSPEAFCEGLERIYQNRMKYDSDLIKKRMKEFSWESIVQNNLAAYLRSIL